MARLSLSLLSPRLSKLLILPNGRLAERRSCASHRLPEGSINSRDASTRQLGAFLGLYGSLLGTYFLKVKKGNCFQARPHFQRRPAVTEDGSGRSQMPGTDICCSCD
jgi:hypothetical protein